MAGVESKCISIIEQRRHPFVFSSMGRDAFSWKSSLLQALTRRLAAYSPLRDIEFEFEPDLQPTNANVGAERLDDILTDLIEGMAGIGVKHIRIVTEVSPGRVAIGLSSRDGLIRLLLASAGSVSITEPSGGSAAVSNAANRMATLNFS